MSLNVTYMSNAEALAAGIARAEAKARETNDPRERAALDLYARMLPAFYDWQRPFMTREDAAASMFTALIIAADSLIVLGAANAAGAEPKLMRQLACCAVELMACDIPGRVEIAIANAVREGVVASRAHDA